MLSSASSTVARLRSLRAGERFPFYKGDLEANIRKCDPTTQDPKGAPNYQKLLMEIRDTASELQKKGQIKVKKVPVSDPRAGREDAYQTFEYVATGC